MEPRLIVTAGPLQGITLALTEKATSIGREPSNHLCLPDMSVSRQHCLLEGEDEQYKIIDLGSFNGTQVNGVSIKEHSLRHGDQIAVGDSLLRFLLHPESDDAAFNGVELVEGDWRAGSTVQLRREDALYLCPENLSGVLLPTERAARDLNSLFRISRAINSIRDPQQLQSQLLELLFEVIPAERGAVLLTGASINEVVSLFGVERDSKLKRAVQVSNTIVTQVLNKGVAVMSNDVQDSSSYDNVESLLKSRVSALLCVPLIFFDAIIGVIYLDTTNRGEQFNEDHLQLMTAIADISTVALENALHLEWLESENQQLHSEANITHNMVGSSARMRAVYQLIARVAPSNSRVLIYGESGTGKELAAQAIHLNSPRVDKPFVAINCAAFTETLIESELFGYEKNAFTGATSQSKGLFEIAHGGTIFLDEIGELPMSAQAKLLRVLEEGEFRRVGGKETIKVDLRVLAATNRNLEVDVREKKFREDLFHRLNVISFEMPPLRERGEDVMLLANHFLAKYSEQHQRRVVWIAPEARAMLISYAWPGNVRELKNTIERAVVLSASHVLTAESLPMSVTKCAVVGERSTGNIYDAVKQAQRLAIINAYNQSKGNHTEASAILGVHPTHLFRLIRILNLKPTLASLKSQFTRAEEQ
jgi:transcriptional regulator with GAF, ATPase, and Fis domain